MVRLHVSIPWGGILHREAAFSVGVAQSKRLEKIPTVANGGVEEAAIFGEKVAFHDW